MVIALPIDRRSLRPRAASVRRHGVRSEMRDPIGPPSGHDHGPTKAVGPWPVCERKRVIWVMNNPSALALAISIATLAACSRETADRVAPAQVAVATAGSSRTACDRVTAQQMSEILGAALNAEPKSSSECAYAPQDGSGLPMAELAVELGSAEAAMAASGLLGRIEPGMTNPYQGMGDQASAIGPAVWVRRGQDLVRITVMGASDHDAAVRRVYALVDKGF